VICPRHYANHCPVCYREAVWWYRVYVVAVFGTFVAVTAGWAWLLWPSTGAWHWLPVFATWLPLAWILVHLINRLQRRTR
jgi:hypothetical protein